MLRAGLAPSTLTGVAGPLGLRPHAQSWSFAQPLRAFRLALLFLELACNAATLLARHRAHIRAGLQASKGRVPRDPPPARLPGIRLPGICLSPDMCDRLTETRPLTPAVHIVYCP